MIKALALCASTAVCALSSFDVAYAQSAPASAAPSPPATALSEVVVTAERRESNLQRAPIAVSAVTGADLERANVNSTEDLTRTTPALVIAPAAGNSPQIFVRGVGTFVANAYSEQAVALNLDGVYISRPAGANGFFYDLQRIEVLKGPQGTLYGRNASGGAVNVLPETPKIGLNTGFIDAEAGNYSSYKVDGAINIPINDFSALRIAGFKSGHDGYLTDGYDDDDGSAVRVQFLTKPWKGWSFRLSGDYYHEGGKGFAQVEYPFADPSNPWRGPSDPVSVAAYLAGLPPAARFNSLNLIPKSNGFVDDTFKGLHGQMDADLGFATLTILPAVRDVREDYLEYVPSAFRVTSHSQQESVETRLASKGGGRLNWVVGFYYFNEDVKANQDYDHGIQETYTNSILSDDTKAVFGQGTYSLTSAFRLTGGVRYTTESKSQDSLFATRTFSPVLPPLTHRVDQKDFDAVTWKVGAEYDLAPHSLLYANIGTGFKAGGFFASSGPDTFDPEKLTAYSLGIKNRFLENRLQLNAEVFDYEYRDQQISHLGPIQTGVAAAPYAPVFITENVGRSQIRGAELEGRYLLTPDDLFSVDVQYLDANYTSFIYNYYATTGGAPPVGCPYTNISATSSPAPAPPGAIYSVNCSGKPANNAPKWTSTLGYQHTFHLPSGSSLTFDVNSYISDSFYTAFDYLPKQIQGSYTQTSLNLTYAPAGAKWSIGGYANNLENAAVISTSFQPNQALGNGLNFAAIRPPRTYGARVSLRY